MRRLGSVRKGSGFASVTWADCDWGDGKYETQRLLDKFDLLPFRSHLTSTPSYRKGGSKNISSTHLVMDTEKKHNSHEDLPAAPAAAITTATTSSPSPALCNVCKCYQIKPEIPMYGPYNIHLEPGHPSDLPSLASFFCWFFILRANIPMVYMRKKC